MDFYSNTYNDVIERVKAIMPDFDSGKFSLFIPQFNMLNSEEISEGFTFSQDKRFVCIHIWVDNGCHDQYIPVCREIYRHYETYIKCGGWYKKSDIYILHNNY